MVVRRLLPEVISVLLTSITYNTSQVLGVTSRRLPGRGLGSKSNLNQRGIGNSMTTDFGEESLSSFMIAAAKFSNASRPSVSSNVVVRIVIRCWPAGILLYSMENFQKRFKPELLKSNQEA